MKRRLNPFVVTAAVAIALLAVLAAGCGGDEAEPAPSEPAPAEPAPAEPAPAEPAPAEPAPAEPAPAEPAPAEPAPAEPAPAEPAPAEPAPTEPAPAEPAPAEPAPAEPGALAPAEPAVTGQSLVVLEDEVAPGLDVDGVNAANAAIHQVLESTMEGLIEYPATEVDGILQPNYKVTAAEFEPRLAESWTSQTSADGKQITWTFTLRKGVIGCAGNEFKADDVVWSFARAKSVSGASPVSWFLTNIGGVLDLSPLAPTGEGDEVTPDDKLLKDTEVKKIDDYTVQITQYQPAELFPRVLEIFALYPYDSVEMQKNATEEDPWAHEYSDQENSPGYGAYCLKSWTKGSEIVLEANPSYYRGQPQYTTVTLRKVPAAANRVASIQNGDADVVTYLTPQDIATLKEDENVSVLSWFNNEILALGFNFAIEPWSTPQGKLIRQAMAHVMPYDAIINDVYLGDAKRWFGLTQSSYYGYLDVKTYETNDVEKAKALLAEAGFPEGEGLDQYEDAFVLNYVAERQGVLEPVVNQIKTAMAQIGIEITLNPITFQQYADRELTKRDMPLFLRDQVRPFGPDVGYTSLLFYVATANGGLVNAGNYVSPAHDEAFFASQAVTGEERLPLLQTMQEIVMDELPLIPILERPSQIVVRKGITCWQTGSSNTIGFWYLRQEGSEPCTTAAREGSIGAGPTA